MKWPHCGGSSRARTAMRVVLLAIAASSPLATAPANAERLETTGHVRAGTPGTSQVPPSPLSLDWCLQRAETANPAIARDRAGLDAARERVGPAGALDDPRLRYEASNVPLGDFDFGSTPLSGHQFGLSQRLPFPGLLAHRQAAAEAGARSSEWTLEDRRLATAAQVEFAWGELGFAQRASKITERNVALLRQFVRIAEARYRVGSGLQQDVLRAQVELTALLDERLTRTAAIEGASARLAALLDLPIDTRFPDTASLADSAAIPELRLLADGLESKSALLRAHAASVEEAERRVRIAEFEGRPDFDLGVGYRVRQRVAGDPVNGDDFVGASVTIRLPVDRSKWRARVAERRAEQRRSEATYRVAHASLLGDLRTAHAELVRADAELSLLRTGLVPQARQSYESSRSAYEVGRTEFLSLLDSQVRLLKSELRLVRAEADRRRAYATLEAAAGERLR